MAVSRPDVGEYITRHYTEFSNILFERNRYVFTLQDVCFLSHFDPVLRC